MGVINSKDAKTESKKEYKERMKVYINQELYDINESLSSWTLDDKTKTFCRFTDEYVQKEVSNALRKEGWFVLNNRICIEVYHPNSLPGRLGRLLKIFYRKS